MFEELKEKGLFLPSGNFNGSFIKKFLRNMTPEQQNWYQSAKGDTLAEKLYLESHLMIPPFCSCGNSLKFISFKEGYRKYCSSQCRAKGAIAKSEQTNIQRYGVAYPAQSKKIQEKMKATNRERYGVENIFEDKQRIQKALIDKYGVENAMSIPGAKEKMKKTQSSLDRKTIEEKRKKTNMERYGHECSLHNITIQQNIRKNSKKKYLKTLFSSDRVREVVAPLFSIEEYQGNIDTKGQVLYYPWNCQICKHSFKDYIANGHIPRCPYCYPPGVKGVAEKEFLLWLHSILPQDIEIIENSRKLISPLEIDMYIPQKKLAIEFDEVYWHCEKVSGDKRGSSYHVGKTEACEAQGIKLIHILDEEWFNRKDIVKSIVRSLLGLPCKSIMARKCEIHKVSPADSRSFYEINHLQGYAGASFRMGLYYQGELVSLLSIGKNRFKKNCYEVVRFASILNTRVSGALSKLWKYAQLLLPPSYEILSYVDRRWFTGESNEKMGLSKDHINPPSFYYTKDFKTLHNRLEFQKHLLSNKIEKFDPHLTEWENMQLNGYDRIWDCGTIVYRLVKV